MQSSEAPAREKGHPAAVDAGLLLRRARSGDERAFEALYRQHVGRVYGLCLRLTSDPQRAEEHTQEVFVRAFTGLEKFQGASALATWLHRMAVNAVFGAWRSRRRRERHLVALDDLDALEARLTGKGLAPTDLDLERSIAKLPPRARAVFVLHDVEGYGHREIAEITEMAEGTSKAHLHRARKLLREALNR